ncbi:hypothetical protein CASFOL_005926 [Castilleja foliolosa]|uniref:Uncharacterized protein n=1 Tax=Castilleja foliolosa TaxID=1961234 RepID=A0ABD3E4V0_9LAMI
MMRERWMTMLIEELRSGRLSEMRQTAAVAGCDGECGWFATAAGWGGG